MKITLDESLKLNPRLNPDLFIPHPRQVLKKMGQTPIKDWLNFIATNYRVDRLLSIVLIPCSFYKPYNPSHDEFYRRINELRRQGTDIKFITVSVPLALEPEEFWDFQWNGHNLVYDCPFFPWIERFGYRWDEKIAEEVFSKLGSVIDHFFERNEDRIGRVIAFFVPSSDELNLVKKHADFVTPEIDPEIDVSYDNNTSEIYCNPVVWRDFEKTLRKFGLLKRNV